MNINKVEFFGKTLIDLTGDTVTADKLVKGATAHDASGTQIVGTFEGAVVNLQSKTATPSTAVQTIIPDSGFTGLEKVTVNAIPQSILDASQQNGYNAGYSIGYDAGYAAAVDAMKPYASEIESIAISGSQYIDTGFKPNQNTVVEMAYICTNTNENTLVGCDTGWTNKGYFVSMNAAAYGNNVATGISMSGSSKTTMRFEGGKIYKNGTLVKTITTSTFQTAYNLTLFALNRSGTKQEFFTGTFCYCKIWDNGTLIRDYICVSDFDGISGVYEKIKKRMVL